jgi:hypothetical protein
MYARMISFITSPGMRTELCRLIELHITPFVRKHHGFVDRLTLVSDEEHRLVTVISLWRTKADAESFNKQAS